MAGSVTDYEAAKIQNYVLGNVAYSPPATVYVGLLTDTNTAAQRRAGTVTEATGTSYARVAVTNNTTNWPNASGANPSSKGNGTAVVFPTAGGSWGTAQAYGLWDASTSGNLLAWADLSAPIAIATGNIVDFPVGALIWTY